MGFYYIDEQSKSGKFDLFEDIMKCGKNPKDKIHSRYENLSYMLDDINEAMSDMEIDNDSDDETIQNTMNYIFKKIYNNKEKTAVTKNIKDNMFTLLNQRWKKNNK
jgi:hypothetical protein